MPVTSKTKTVENVATDFKDRVTEPGATPTGGGRNRYREKAAELAAKAGIIINGPNPWDPQIHDERTYRRVFREPSLGLGESYMEGWWDCEALEEFFFRITRADLTHVIRRSPGVWWTHLLSRMFNPQDVRGAREVVDIHYNSGNDHFDVMLGRSKAYSCAYFKDTDSLDEAQDRKLDLICRKLQLKPSDRVLDIGSGWGSFTRYAAERFGCKIVGITPAEEQIAFCRQRDGHLPIEYIQADYRQPEIYNPDGRPFDKIVSVGMFEHVGYKNYRDYFQVAYNQLKDGGLFLLHTFGENATAIDLDAWTHRYIYPNGMAPSIAQIGNGIENLFVMEDWHNFGYNYYRTYMKWLENMDRQWADRDKRHPFYRMWRYFLCLFGGNFKSRRNVQLWQIVLSKGGADGVYDSVR